MDFAYLINSQDVREYHRKIDYKYNSMEAAWLVYMCDSITLSERHNAWKWIINNMPDETVFLGADNDYTQSVSLHGFLVDCIKMDQEYVETFIDDIEGGYFYWIKGIEFFLAGTPALIIF